MTTPIEQALEAVREAVLARHRDAQDRVRAIRAALDAYEAAVEHDIAAEFAARNGVGEAAPKKAVPAAHDLRATVDALPELVVSVTREFVSAPLPEPPSSRPEPAPTPVRRPPAPRDPASIALEREVDSIDWDEVPDNVFVKYAEEFAARARALQQRAGAEGPTDDYEGRLIRRLTAMVHERGAGGVYGLSLRHSGDWATIARRAREERLRLQVIGDAARPLAQKLLSAEDAARIAVNARDEEDDVERDPHEEPLDLPALQAAAEHAALVMVGGIVKHDKLERARRRTGIEIEWIPITPDASAGGTVLARRIRERRVAGVVLLHGLMSHTDYEPIVDAARATAMPVAYAGKAGKGSLVRALVELDGMLARSSSTETKAASAG